jgi:hypothetical protein
VITRLQSVLPQHAPPVPDITTIVIVHYVAQDDVVYWCGYTNGHDGQGWSADRSEALEFATYRAAMDERVAARRWHPKMLITLRNCFAA